MGGGSGLVTLPVTCRRVVRLHDVQYVPSSGLRMAQKGDQFRQTSTRLGSRRSFPSIGLAQECSSAGGKILSTGDTYSADAHSAAKRPGLVQRRPCALPKRIRRQSLNLYEFSKEIVTTCRFHVEYFNDVPPCCVAYLVTGYHSLFMKESNDKFSLIRISFVQKNKSFLKSWLLDLLMGELNINCYRRCSFLMAPREFFHSQSLALFKESFSELFVNR